METHLNLKICKNSWSDMASHRVLFETGAASTYRFASCILGQQRHLLGPQWNPERNALQSGIHPKSNNGVGNHVDDPPWRKEMEV